VRESSTQEKEISMNPSRLLSRSIGVARSCRVLMLAALPLIPIHLGCSYDTTTKAGADINAVATEAPLYVLSTATWPQPQIQVCWSVTGAAADMQTVHDAVTTSWQAQANVRFAGWSTSCPTPFTGIALTAGTNNVTVGGLGTQSTGVQLDFSGSPQTTWAQCTVNSLSRSACIAATAIHEFGHALGFSHEQNRPDNNGQCTQAPQGTNGDTTIGPFDLPSIMDYCISPGTAVNLSRGDINGVMIVYGMAPALIVTVTS
jgi:hypothetical protein